MGFLDSLSGIDFLPHPDKKELWATSAYTSKRNFPERKYFLESVTQQLIVNFVHFPILVNAILVILLCFDLRPGQKKMLFQGDALEGSDTFQWPVIERDCVSGLRLMIWEKVKVPLCQYRLMHQKRVTSELHDSYFRLMTIKHSISKIQWAIVWALNYYLTQLSSSPSSSCQ